MIEGSHTNKHFIYINDKDEIYCYKITSVHKKTNAIHFTQIENGKPSKYISAMNLNLFEEYIEETRIVGFCNTEKELIDEHPEYFI